VHKRAEREAKDCIAMIFEEESKHYQYQNKEQRMPEQSSICYRFAQQNTSYRLVYQVWEDRSNRNEQIIDLLQSYPNPWKNEVEYFDMNAMPRVIPMCPNMNMIHILSLRDKNYQRYFIE
jgi:hypothetical protein